MKENNRYYTDIVIGKEVLHSLPENGTIDDLLSQLDDIEGHDFNGDDDGLEDSVYKNFVPIPLLSPNKESAIDDTLARIQADVNPVLCQP